MSNQDPTLLDQTAGEITDQELSVDDLARTTDDTFTADQPAPGSVVEEGRIREVVYVGMITRYIVDLEQGGSLTVVRQSLETTSTDVVEARGRPVRLEWRPEHTYEIDPGGETEDE